MFVFALKESTRTFTSLSDNAVRISALLVVHETHFYELRDIMDISGGLKFSDKSSLSEVA